MIAIYLDTDCNGNDLQWQPGLNVTAGWYLFAWPFNSEPISGPYEHEQEAVKAGWVGHD